MNDMDGNGNLKYDLHIPKGWHDRKSSDNAKKTTNRLKQKSIPMTKNDRAQKSRERRSGIRKAFDDIRKYFVSMSYSCDDVTRENVLKEVLSYMKKEQDEKKQLCDKNDRLTIENDRLTIGNDSLTIENDRLTI
ncbi:5340_t:CDS:2 [Racocetra persica]|uniref:5340_t:CDS:1 n=1 Tax=Racocetra persica TaxID=160502 RepID=A0ACA9MIB1_9GLOM|nr:5340_t:CDS:2 [Racocetra persica]